ncbi:hypothetical protein ROTAS13_03872 [Roseomonas sp. TAS13]|nr:hypothetical protein ROTAS13_03872 [Roseomonas sp. TAS13]
MTPPAPEFAGHQQAEHEGRNSRGHFRPGQSGNPAGRRKGSRNVLTAALDALAEEAAPAVLAAVIEQARRGDVRAAELLLKRLWPEKRPIVVDLPPVHGTADLPAAVGALLMALADGQMPTADAADLFRVLDAARGVFEAAELEARIAALEAAKSSEEA